MRVQGVLISDSEALALVRLLHGALRLDQRVAALVTPEASRVLRELNEAARAEQRHRVDQEWRRGLVPIAEASRMTGIPARTIRERCQRGLVPAVRDGSRWLVEV